MFKGSHEKDRSRELKIFKRCNGLQLVAVEVIVKETVAVIVTTSGELSWISSLPSLAIVSPHVAKVFAFQLFINYVLKLYDQKIISLYYFPCILNWISFIKKQKNLFIIINYEENYLSRKKN